MDAAQRGQIKEQIHQGVTVVREVVGIQQQQLAVLRKQLVQQTWERLAASLAIFTPKLPEFTGAGRGDMWVRIWRWCSHQRSVTRRPRIPKCARH